MNPVAYIKKAITHPDKIVTNLGRRGLLNWMSDEAYIKLLYYSVFRKMPDLNNPTTFSEKIQWLKLHDRNPLYTKLVDKYEVKQYVGDIIGDEYIIPTLGVWDKFEDIDFDALPNQFVLKCTHDSGGVVICKDKTQLNKEDARKKINRSLKQNFYYYGREWPYKDVPPRIIAEKFMVDEECGELRDYKFFCFGGVAKCFKVDFDRFIEHHANYFDAEGNLLKLGELVCPPDYERELPLPPQLDEMKELAEELTHNNSFLRADFYDVNGSVYFGELTFFPDSGLGRFNDESWNELMGQWLEIPSGGGYLLILDELVVRLNKKGASDLVDYKFYCFNGEEKYCQVISNRSTNETIDFFDMEWQLQPFTGLTDGVKNSLFTPYKPSNFEKMKEIAQKLALENAFSRVDLYSLNDRVYFGEITLYPYTGMGSFRPVEWNEKLGSLITI